MKSRLFRATFLFLFLFLAAATTSALAVSGKIKGKVTDPDGNPLAGVKITLLDPDRGQTYSMETDKKGNYYMMGISPASYRLTLEKAGFKALEGRVAIAPDKENVFDAVLAPEARQVVKPEWEDKSLRANELFRQRKYEEAAAAYREILALSPDLATIHFNLGNCAYNLHRYDEAIASFREAIRLKPDFFDAYTNLANASGKLKRFDEAIALFEDAIGTYPENAVLHSSLGLLYLNSGRVVNATEHLEKATAMDPKAAFPFYSLGIAYTQTGEFEKAIASYEKYIALITDATEIERVRGVIEQLKSLGKK